MRWHGRLRLLSGREGRTLSLPRVICASTLCLRLGRAMMPSLCPEELASRLRARRSTSTPSSVMPAARRGFASVYPWPWSRRRCAASSNRVQFAWMSGPAYLAYRYRTVACTAHVHNTTQYNIEPIWRLRVRALWYPSRLPVLSASGAPT
ncbi:hypothetical protein B0H19DRAFT_1151408 [Mycena capillaripes]|nr:hypothetical protein B0H19DRAFT_1151408 [Mycena capillaripes]